MPKPLEHPTHRVVYALKGCCSTPGSPRRAQHPTLYSHNAVFDEYLKISGKPIERSIRAELSGDFEKLMLAVGTVVRLGGETITGIAGAAWCSTSTSGVRGWLCRAGCHCPPPHHFVHLPCSEVRQKHSRVFC